MSKPDYDQIAHEMIRRFVDEDETTGLADLPPRIAAALHAAHAAGVATERRDLLLALRKKRVLGAAIGKGE